MLHNPVDQIIRSHVFFSLEHQCVHTDSLLNLKTHAILNNTVNEIQFYTWTDFTNGKQVKIYEDSYTLTSQDDAKYEFNLHFIFSVEAYTCIVIHAKIDSNCTSLVRTYRYIALTVIDFENLRHDCRIQYMFYKATLPPNADLIHTGTRDMYFLSTLFNLHNILLIM